MSFLVYLIYAALIALVLAGLWKAFVKAGLPGWAGIVPIYNLYLLLLMAKRPVWWLAVLLLVPFVNLYFAVLLFIEKTRDSHHVFHKTRKTRDSHHVFHGRWRGLRRCWPQPREPGPR